MTTLPDEILLDVAAGTAPEAVALFVAAHAALSPEARAVTRQLDAVGGALLEGLAPAPLATDARARALAALDQPVHLAPPPAWQAPLARLVAGRFDEIDTLPWRKVVRDVHEIPLVQSGRGEYRAELLRIAPGRAIPHHTHRGDEMTLVLAGGFADETGHYARGDVQIVDASVTHQPRADLGPDCICLIVANGPIRLTGRLMRLLNPLMRG